MSAAELRLHLGERHPPLRSGLTEQEVRRVLEQRFREAAATGRDGVMSAIADDVVSDDHDTPRQYVGAAGFREVCRPGFTVRPRHRYPVLPAAATAPRTGGGRVRTGAETARVFGPHAPELHPHGAAGTKKATRTGGLLPGVRGGSLTRIRTSNLPVNSRTLYR